MMTWFFFPAPLQHGADSSLTPRNIIGDVENTAVFQYHTIVMAFKRYPIKFSSSIRSCSLTAAASLLSFFFLIQIVAILGLISGEPQKCGLLTFRNAKLWSDLVLCTHTHTHRHAHSRGGPLGLETGSGQIYPCSCQNCDLSTPQSGATDVARQSAKGMGGLKREER